MEMNVSQEMCLLANCVLQCFPDLSITFALKGQFTQTRKTITKTICGTVYRDTDRFGVYRGVCSSCHMSATGTSATLNLIIKVWVLACETRR